MSREAYELVAGQAVAKGDVLAVAEVAGVMAAKRTGELIPLCHPLGLDHVQVDVALDPELPGVRVTATARVTGRTGVEMEALTAVARGMSHSLRHGESRGSGDGHRRRPTGEQDRGTRGDWRRSRLIGQEERPSVRRLAMKRPTDTYGERPGGRAHLLVEGRAPGRHRRRHRRAGRLD